MSEVSNKVAEYRAAVKALKPFDLSCCFPVRDQNTLGDFHDREKIIADLSKFGIEKAVFWNMECLYISPERGNEDLIELTKNHPNCYICPVLAPDLDLEPGMLDKYLDHYAEHRMKAARMFPATLKHSMDDWAVGNILSALEKRGIPLILWHTQVSWEKIADIAAKYPKLKLVIEAIDKKMLYHSKNQYKLIKAFKNVYFGSYNLAQYSFLDAVDTEHDCRMVLATNYPVSDPNMSFGIITEGHLSDKTKAFICHGFTESI